jgi:hypothetical protein
VQFIYSYITITTGTLYNYKGEQKGSHVRIGFPILEDSFLETPQYGASRENKLSPCPGIELGEHPPHLASQFSFPAKLPFQTPLLNL